MKPGGMVQTGVMVAALAGLAGGQNLAYRQDPQWMAPLEASAKPNPLARKPEVVGGGRKLFLRNCSECHGDDGRGLKSAADLQLPVVQSQSDGTLLWKITNGNVRHGMPAFSQLPEMQRWQIICFLRTLKPPPEPSSSGVNPPNRPKEP
jgi:mono/diheme cytochrome c family protein